MNTPQTCRRCLAGHKPVLRVYFSSPSTSTTSQSSRGLQRSRLEPWFVVQRQDRHNTSQLNRHPYTRKTTSPLSHLQGEQRTLESRRALTSLEPIDYNIYGDTSPPSPHQLEFANRFFNPSEHSPTHLWSSSLFRTIPHSEVAEVAFVGRSNIGKSTLVNALVGKGVCRASTKFALTTEFQAFGVGGKTQFGSKLSLVDLPGYGKASQEEWGDEILKYFTKRKQLRRVFVLVSARDGLKPKDVELLQLLEDYAVPHQIIFNKIDTVIMLGKHKKVLRGFHYDRLTHLDALYAKTSAKINTNLKPSSSLLKDILVCNAKMERESRVSLGIEAIQWAILRAAGLEQAVL